MEGNIGKWCSFPKGEQKFKGRITNVIRHEPVVYQIEVHEIPMFKSADEIDLIDSKANIPLNI